MAAPEAEELRSRIQSALQCIASPYSTPGTIQQAQEALLQWEEAYTDQYAVALASLMGVTSAAAGAVEEASAAATAAEGATLRLSAVLAMKAAVARRWKDRGRGRAGTPKKLLSEGVRASLRRSMLNLVFVGEAEGRVDRTGVLVADPNELTSRRVELITDRPLQTNAASLLSKVARMDLPLEWRELIPSLVEGVVRAHGTVHRMKQQPGSQQTQQQLRLFRTILYNAMNSLEAVLTEISTQRLLVDRKFRNSIASRHLGSVVESGLMPSLHDLESTMEDVAPNGGADGGGDRRVFALRYAALASRVVFRMTASSFSKLAEEAPSLADRVLTCVHSSLSRWIPRVADGGRAVDGALRDPLEQLLLVHCGLVVDLQRSHQSAFARYLRPFLDLFYSSLMRIVGVLEETDQRVANFGSGINTRSSDQFAIAFLSFLANVVGASKYAELDAANTEVASFFNPSLVRSLSRTLLQLFSIHISPVQISCDDDGYGSDNDAVLWRDDPEAFYHWEASRSSEEDVGCAAQNLFLALAESPFSCEVVLPWLLESLTNMASQRLAVELECGISAGVDARIVSSALPLGVFPAKLSRGEDGATTDLILQWDAIYTAAGLAGSILEKCPGFDFRSWFDASLGPCSELLLRQGNGQHAQLPILERRMIWLLSCNAHQVAMSSQFNPLGMVASAISAQNVCVRLTAIDALDALLPHCQDVPSLLHSIVEPTVPALYRLVNECAEVESRSSCLDLLSNLICVQTAGSLTNEILNAVVSPLSAIWDNAIDQNLLLRRSVLAILSCIASLVGPESCSVLYPLALPMIDQSFARDENVFLVGEALKIWWVFLRLSKTYDPLLGKLFVHAVELSKDFENLMILMRVTEHYINLGREDFLNEHAITIQTVLSNVVGEVRPRGTTYIYLVIEALLRSFPVEGGFLLKGCGLLNTLIQACAGNYFENDKCEPDRVIVLYLTALARVLLSKPDSVQLPLKLPSGDLFGEEEMVSLYLVKFQVAGDGAHGLLFQKLWALLLLSFYPPCLLESCCHSVLRKSNSIFNIFIYVLNNAHPNGSNVLSYEVGYDDEEEAVYVGEDIHEALMQEQRTKDIVFSTSLHQAVSAKMNGLHIELCDKYKELFIIENDVLLQLEKVLASWGSPLMLH